MLDTLLRTGRSSAARVVRFPADVAHRRRTAAHRKELGPPAEADRRLLEALEAEGCAVSDLDTLALPSAAAMLAGADRLLAVMEEILPRTARGEHRPLRAPQIFTATDLPEFQAFGAEPRLLAIAERYLGSAVTFQGVHVRRDFANDEPVTTELWHKDLEDRRMLKVIVYLRDVTDAEGPFEYARKSAMSPASTARVHWLTAKNQSMGVTDAQMAEIVPRSEWRQCTGPRGATVLMDPVAMFHHGRPRTEDRSAAFFVYTSASPLRPELCRQYRDDTFTRPAPSGN